MREGYKETSVGVIPQDWEVGSLGENCNINMGQSPSSDTYNDSYGLPLIQGNADIKNRVTFPRNYTSEPTKTCNIDDIIMTVRAPVGAIAKSKHEACIGRGVCSITPQKTSIDYTYQYLISYEDQWSKLEQGSTFTAVNGADIKKLSIPLPPLPEQEKIASILTIVDDKIESIDKQIESATELKKGLMQKLFQEGIGHSEFKDSPVGRIPAEWEVKKLKNCVNFIAGYAFSSKDFTDKGTQLVRMGNLYQNRLSLERNPVYLPDSFVNDNPRYVIKSGDIILSMTGTAGKEDYGFAVVIPQMNNVLLLNQRVVKLEWLDNCEQFYLAQYLWTRYFLDQLYSLPGGTKQANLSVKQIESIVIPLPSKDEQKQIADILTCADDKISVLKEKKEAYTKLKKGLMQKLLTGEVRVKVDA